MAKRMTMENNHSITLSLMGLLLLSTLVEPASRPAPSPAVDCSTLTLTMADCLSFVTSGSTVETPEGTCCSGLKTTLKTDAECLCEGFKSSAQMGITLNMTKALSLPAACHVSAPSFSDCGLNIDLAGGAPADSPTASSPSSSLAPAASPISSGTTEVAAAKPSGSGSSKVAATSFGSSAMGLLVAYLSFFF